MKKVCVFSLEGRLAIVDDELNIDIFGHDKDLVNVLVDDYTKDGRLIYATPGAYAVLIMSKNLEKIDHWELMTILTNVSIFNEEVIAITDGIVYDRLARGTILNKNHPMVIAIKYLILAEILLKAKKGSLRQHEIAQYTAELLDNYIENKDSISKRLYSLMMVNTRNLKDDFDGDVINYTKIGKRLK